VVATGSDSILRSDEGEIEAILTRRSRLRVDGWTVSGQYLGDAHPMPTVDDERGT